MNLIRTISTTYSDILQDIDTDSRTSELPFFLKSLVAGVFAILSIRINVAQNQCYIETVEDRDLANQVLAVNDYSLQGKNPSEVELTVNIDPSLTISSTYTVNVENLTARSEQDGDTPPYDFEARTNLTFAIGESSKTHLFYQQTTIDETTIDTTVGGNSQEYFSSILDLITDTLEIEINGNIYTPVDTFAFSTASDYHFKHIVLSDGSSKFLFGFVDETDSEQFGFIPASGNDVILRGAFGGGILGNRPANTITNYTGNDAGVLSVNNISAATGGSERESLDNARNSAPIRIRSHGMFWNEETGRQLILDNVTGLANVVVDNTAPFTFSITLVPIGGGFTTASKKAEVTSLMADQFFNQLIITILDPVYSPYNVTTQVELQAGYSLSNIDRYIKLAQWLRTYEQSYYVKEYYNNNGLLQTINLINTLDVLTGYTYDIDQDGNEIRILLDNMVLTREQFKIRDRDIDSFVMVYVEGVKFSKTTSPTSLTVPKNQILTPSSLSVSEIS